MQNIEWLKIKEIFHQTLDLPMPERKSFLANQEDFVRSEVSRLLESHEIVDDFIAEPIALEIGLDTNSYIGKTIGNYKILSLLGIGGMGQVFLAEKEGLDKKFALKIIKRGMDTDSILKRFLRERQILSRLEHPNIATLLDAGSTENDLPFFVMEFIDGEPITRFCDNHQFDTNERLEIFQKVCEAVKYAHQNLIIHRDIKPSNVLVTADGVPKLLDFGIAKLLNSDEFENTTTALQSRMLTPEYASPEQINGQPITTATDVYSLGVVLYELLSGVRPFKSNNKSYQEVTNLVLTQEPLRPSSVVSGQWSVARNTNENKGQKTNDERQIKFRNPQSAIRNLKGDLDNIILKSLRKEPERRYQSVQEFSEDIRRYLVGLPVTATADTGVYRFKKFVNRHQIGTIFAALILSVSSFAVWQSFVANRERAKAETHVAQVRDVAKSLLNETGENLRLSSDKLEVRQALIEKSTKALEELSVDVDDAEFLSELGYAYQQLGYSQTWHIRDYENALPNLKKGRALLERAVELEPKNPKYLEKLAGAIGSLREFYGIQGNNEAVFETYQAYTQIGLKLIELEPENAKLYFDNSNNYNDLSEYLSSLNRKTEADEALNRSLELSERAVQLQQAKEQTPAVKADLAFYMQGQGLILRTLDRKDEALKVLQHAVEVADQAYAEDNTLKFAFNHSVRNRNMMAEIYISRGEWQKALALNEICLQRLIQNQNNPNLVQKQMPSAIAIYTMRVGFALDKTGKKEAGRKKVEQGLEIYLTNLKKYENLAADIMDAQGFLSFASNYYVEIGEKRKAADLWQKEFINRLEKILQKTPNDIGMLLRTADGYTHKGDALSGFKSDDNSISETNRAFLKEALENYQKALEYVEKVNSIGESGPTSKQKQESLEQKISLLQSKLAK